MQDYHQAFPSGDLFSGSRRPALTLAWIAAHVPRGAKFKILAARAPTVTLYTDRYCLAFLPARNADMFRDQLLKNGISHVLLEPISILFVSADPMSGPVRVWEETPQWLSSRPRAYRPVFQNDAEATTIYEVIPDK
jgi:hypothetical protein